MIKERTKPIENTEDQASEERNLILHNDDHNTFDFVIDTLIEVCDHDPVTAEQLTLIVHYKGKCAVKSGDLEELQPMSREMTDRGLTVTIK
jgi:ATP-dependent Clp protease adaptor protein ClpS